MRSHSERDAVWAFEVAVSFATTGRWSATGAGGTADSAAGFELVEPAVVPDPFDGGCWSDVVEPAAPAAAALWSELLLPLAGAGDACFGARALLRALRADVLFVAVDFVCEGADSTGAVVLVFSGGAGATPLS